MVGAGAVGAVAFAANQIILLVNNLSKILRDGRSPKRRDRSGMGSATSIEKRTLKGQRLIRQLGKIARSSEKAVNKVEELFEDKGDN